MLCNLHHPKVKSTHLHLDLTCILHLPRQWRELRLLFLKYLKIRRNQGVGSQLTVVIERLSHFSLKTLYIEHYICRNNTAQEAAIYKYIIKIERFLSYMTLARARKV